MILYYLKYFFSAEKSLLNTINATASKSREEVLFSFSFFFFPWLDLLLLDSFFTNNHIINLSLLGVGLLVLTLSYLLGIK